MSDVTIDAATIEILGAGAHPKQVELERILVGLARAGGLKGVVSKPARYSATTIQNFSDCQRKFFWPTLAGLEQGASKSMQFGTKLHAMQERYLLTGEQPPQHNVEGKLASIGLQCLPKPQSLGLYVEQKFDAQFDGVPVVITGTRDFGVDPVDTSATTFLLGDHKTARSKRWPKTKEWLQGNIQANLYAYTKWAELYAAGFTQLTTVDKQWVYYFKEEKMVEKLRVVDSLEHVAQQFDNVIKPAVITMAKMAAEAPRLEDIPLPSDRSVCDSYGGCPHRARCFGFGQRESNMGVLAGRFSQAAILEKAQAATTAGAGGAINPPKAPQVPAALQAAPAIPQTEQAADVQADVQADVPAEAKPKRQRKAAAKPAGAEQLVADVAAQVDAAFAPAAEQPTRRGMSKMTPGSNAAHDFWLFIGCGPEKGFEVPTMLVEEVIGSAQAKAAERMGAGHYREGQSYGVLEAAFATWLEENPLQGAIIVDPNSIVTRDVIGLLRAHATMVFGRRQ